MKSKQLIKKWFISLFVKVWILLCVGFSFSVLSASVAAAEPIVERFDQYCSRCHIKGQAGAPLMSDHKAWLQRWEASGTSGFLNALVNGKGRMPKQGGCFECTTSDFQDLIGYLVDYHKLSH